MFPCGLIWTFSRPIHSSIEWSLKPVWNKTVSSGSSSLHVTWIVSLSRGPNNKLTLNRRWGFHANFLLGTLSIKDRILPKQHYFWYIMIHSLEKTLRKSNNDKSEHFGWPLTSFFACSSFCERVYPQYNLSLSSAYLSCRFSFPFLEPPRTSGPNPNTAVYTYEVHHLN